MNIEMARSFFLWCTVINYGLLIFWALLFLGAHDWFHRPPANGHAYPSSSSMCCTSPGSRSTRSASSCSTSFRASSYISSDEDLRADEVSPPGPHSAAKRTGPLDSPDRHESHPTGRP
jgi:hypothetical protein